jgi:hypothetical protein
MYLKNFTPLLYSVIALILISCTAQAQTNYPKTKTDVCTLITKEEIQFIQKEPVKEVKSNSQTFDNRLITQCFYQMTTYAKSISVQVTQADPEHPEKANLLAFWNKTFHSRTEMESESERESERENERENEKGKKKEIKKNKQPNGLEKISNLGDEAFLAGNRITRALYVLKKNNIIRISIGGGESEQVKIQKMKVLAGKLINRL